MANQKIAYGAASQAITITLASLANAAYRESTAVDNTANLFLDALLYLAVKTGAGAPSGEKVVKVFFVASEDGTNFSDVGTGVDGGITPGSPSNLLGPAIIQTPSAATTYKVVIPVAQYFGGVLPPKWGIVIQNATGGSLDTTEGNHTKEYRGIYGNIA